jgi:hypothetical protein
MGNPVPSATYFQRHEQKYLLNAFQYHTLLRVLEEFAHPDEYGLSTVYSIYYDTGNFEIARKALEKSTYKEKLRLRSYGIPRPGDLVYLELKKKFDGVTYKRRIPLPFDGMEKCLDLGPDLTGQNYVFDEIKWFLQYYKPIPQFLISYNRLAFRGREHTALRITFDTHIRGRAGDLDFSQGPGGQTLLDEDTYLMEVKTGQSIPLFLTARLTELRIFPLSFSKYRRALENLFTVREARYA